jgi:hypothetical protein
LHLADEDITGNMRNGLFGSGILPLQPEEIGFGLPLKAGSRSNDQKQSQVARQVRQTRVYLLAENDGEEMGWPEQSPFWPRVRCCPPAMAGPA